MKRSSLLTVLALAACAPAGAISEDGTDAQGASYHCTGSPDRAGGITCTSNDELWTCEVMPNAARKCVSQIGGTPDGQEGWTCTHSGSDVSCVKQGVATGGAGWTCTTDGAKTTCTTNGGDVPPGGGSWTCNVQEMKITCEGSGPLAGAPGAAGGSTGTGGTGTGTGGTGTSGSGSGTGSNGSGTGNGKNGSGTGSGTGTGTGTGTGSSTTPTSKAFLCSYGMIVFTWGGQTWVVKVPQGATTCTITNKTSSDATFNYSCNGATYTNAPDYIMSRNGTDLVPFGGSVPCSALFNVNGRYVTAGPGVNILYAVAHNGSFPNHFADLCPAPGGTNSLTFPAECGG
ncbi:MAG: hypothetical protein IT371_21415 [Deltaproteobacteria bacterium]|nr:hypothetical protein [Deltaproteobacteria bacterium]